MLQRVLFASLVASAAADQMFERLKKLELKGFSPVTILDAGANKGDWTRSALAVWPRAKFLMVEPTPMHEPSLRGVQPAQPYAITLIGERQTTVSMWVDQRKTPGTGNSLYFESAAPRVGAFRQEERNMTTIDRLLEERGMGPPQLIKLDVQGAELRALDGASRALQTAEVVLIEVSLVEWNVGQPLWFEVHAYMEMRGFSLYDVVEMRYGGSPNFMLQQADLLFVRRSSRLWSKRHTGVAPPTVWPRATCTFERDGASAQQPVADPPEPPPPPPSNKRILPTPHGHAMPAVRKKTGLGEWLSGGVRG